MKTSLHTDREPLAPTRKPGDFLNEKVRVALSSVTTSVLLTALKLVVGLATHSLSLLSEAFNSLLDIGASFLTYVAVKISGKPADEDHPYGHGKVESVSALIATGLLFLTSGWVIWEAVKRMVYPTVEVEVAWYSFAVLAVSIVVSLVQSRALMAVARKTSSQALEAQALNFRSDVWSSSVVVLGLGLVSLGWQSADALASIGVACFIAHAGYSLGRRTIEVLIDTAPAGVADQVAGAAKQVEGVVGIERVRVRPAGVTVGVELEVYVNRTLPLDQVHQISRLVEEKVRHAVPEADLFVVAKPLPLDTETIMDQVHLAAKHLNLSVHHVVVHQRRGHRHLSCDVEVDGTLPLKKAHEVVSELERIIRQEVGNDLAIDTHIEPRITEILESELVNREEGDLVKQAVEECAKSLGEVSDVHNIRIQKQQGRLFVSLHLGMDDDVPVELAHDLVSRYESLIKARLAVIQRVVVHAEPKSKISLRPAKKPLKS